MASSNSRSRTSTLRHSLTSSQLSETTFTESKTLLKAFAIFMSTPSVIRLLGSSAKSMAPANAYGTSTANCS